MDTGLGRPRTATGPGSEGPDRFDPFVLPQATTSQFLLLMVLTLAAAAYAYDLVVGDWAAGYLRCAADATKEAVGSSPRLVTEHYVACVESLSVHRGALGVGAAVLLAFALFVSYRSHPRILIRRQGLRPFDDVRFPDAAQELAQLVRESGLTRAPQFLVHPFRMSPGGRAFGYRPHYYVRLNLGLVKSVTDETRPVLRAIVRHELAHLRNRDVDRTILALVSGWAFAAVVAVPLMVATAVRAPADLWPLGWRLAVAFAMISLARASVLRSREHYADVRASVANLAAGERAFLVEAFPGPPRPEARFARLWWWLSTPLRLHPTTTRDRTVARPDSLLAATAVQAVATGVLLGLTLPYLVESTTRLSAGNRWQGVMLAAMLLGALTVAVLGVGLWRQTLHALADRLPLPTGLAPGAALAAGILLGEAASSRLGDAESWLDAVRHDLAQGALAALLLCLGCLLFTRWSVAVAAAWLPTARGRTLTPVLLAGQLVGALVFGSGLTAWSVGTAIITQGGGRLSLLVGILGSTLDLTVLLPVLVAAAFPLAAAVRRSGGGRRLHLDSTIEATLPRPRQRPWLALLPPVLPFAAAVVVDQVWPGELLTMLTGLADRLDNLLGGDERALAQTYSLLFSIALVQLGVAVVVAVVATRRDEAGLGPAHTLVASVLTGYLLLAALLGVAFVKLCATEGCERPYDGLLALGGGYRAIGGLGVLAAVLAALPVAAIHHIVRHRAKVSWPGSPGRRGPAEHTAWGSGLSGTPPSAAWGSGLSGTPSSPSSSLPSGALSRLPSGASSLERRVPRRWTRPVATVLTALLVLGYLTPAAASWLADNGHLPPNRSVPVVPDAPDLADSPPGAPGSVPARQACLHALATFNRFALPGGGAVANAAVARTAIASDAPALRSFGQVLGEAGKNGDIPTGTLATKAITTYCRWILAGMETPKAPSAPSTGPSVMPPVLAFGQTYTAPDGDTITASVPVRTATAGSSAAVVQVTIRTGADRPRNLNALTPVGMVDGRQVRMSVTPGSGTPADGMLPPAATAQFTLVFPLPDGAAILLLGIVDQVGNPQLPMVVFGGQVPADQPQRPTPTPSNDVMPSPTPSRTPAVIERTVRQAQFTLPSRNIMCYLAEDYNDGSPGARCDIMQRSWSPPEKPAGCLQDYGHAFLVDATSAMILCAGDAVVEEHNVLAYGQALRAGPIVCTSSRTGVVCRNDQTGHGFLLSRSSYSIF